MTILTGNNCVLLNSCSIRIYWRKSFATSGLFHVYTINYVLHIPLLHIEEYRYLKKVFHQNDHKDNKSERLLFSTSFTTKFELVFVLTQENAFPWRFHFKVRGKEHRFFYKTVLRIFKIALHMRDRHAFM